MLLIGLGLTSGIALQTFTIVKSRTAARVGGHVLMDSQFVAVIFSMSQKFLLNWMEKGKM